MRFLIPFSAVLSLAWAQDLCGQYSYYSANGYYFNNNAWGQGSGSGSQCTHVDKLLNPGVAWHTDWNCQIGSIPTKAEWRYLGNNIRANIAYDLFTAADPNHDTSFGDYELMVWIGRKGGVYPIGSSVGNVNVAGRTWELWVGYNGAMKVFSFVAPSEIAVFESNLKPFFDHITNTQGFPASRQHLITYQFGSEPFTGSNARFDVWYFYGEVN
ncbi:hypothetical protein NUW58_g9821 [Xylaria curta]|uniref:Uncharacterized protein n=1 Tax=Xylaria curta TaxID=42375 RepID=A0ACC1MU48_9PEZI|nr:hypothetical protein NUW58_g9821 [Xylaria curta]